jgi:hypothetical protein
MVAPYAILSTLTIWFAPTNTIAECIGVSPPKVKLPRLLVWPGVYLLELAGAIVRRDVPFSRRSLKFFTGNTAFSTQKSYTILGFQAQVEIAEGMKQTYQWINEAAQF